MYVYVRSEATLWTVGFYRPDGRWESESDHGSADEAAKRGVAERQPLTERPRKTRTPHQASPAGATFGSSPRSPPCANLEGRVDALREHSSPR